MNIEIKKPEPSYVLSVSRQELLCLYACVSDNTLGNLKNFLEGEKLGHDPLLYTPSNNIQIKLYTQIKQAVKA